MGNKNDKKNPFYHTAIHAVPPTTGSILHRFDDVPADKCLLVNGVTTDNTGLIRLYRVIDCGLLRLGLYDISTRRSIACIHTDYCTVHGLTCVHSI